MTPPPRPGTHGCPICAGPTSLMGRKLARGKTWDLHRCAGCGHAFISNRPTMDELRDLYAGETHHACATPTGADLERRADCRTLVSELVALARARGRSLDIGSGNGGFSYHLARHGFAPTMIDLDPRAREAAKVIPGSAFHLVALEDLTDPGPFAAMVMSQVLEHALDPMDWLRRAHGLLSPGGVLAVAVPNFAGIYALLGMRDPFIIPPVHLNYFTRRSLRLAFERAGLSPVKFCTRSEITVDISGRRTPLKRRLIAGAWNLASKPLNLTMRGIVLRGYARRD